MAVVLYDMIVCEWPLQFSFHYYSLFSTFLHPPTPTCSDEALYPSPRLSIYENHNFLDKVNYIKANVNEMCYGGVSRRAAVSWIQKFFQLNFSQKIAKPNQNSSCDDAQLLFVPDKLDPNQTKLSEFRLSRICWRIPKSRLPGSLLGTDATVQNSGGGFSQK